MPRRKNPRRCPGPLGRREWLKIGGLSLGALAVGAAPNLCQLLAAEPASPAVDRDFSVILFWANGGPSHIDLFDMKPAAPREYRGPFKPTATNVSGIEITEQLPRLAKMADKFSIVRSLHHERNEHSGGTNRFLTGYASRAANLARSEFPMIGSVVAKKVGQSAFDVPTFVANTPFYGGGPAYLGPAHAPYMPKPNPLTASGANRYDPVPIFTSGADDDPLFIDSSGVLNLQRRQKLLTAIDEISRQIDDAGAISGIDELQQRAVEMLTSQRTRKAFDLTQEDPKVRARYGDTHWGKSLLTCRRLVQAGVRFVQCQATFRLKPVTGRTSNWDDHSVNSDIFKAYQEKLPYFDQSVTALIEDLYARGMNQHVLFVFCGEFGRTPLIRNQHASGRPGRDHWSRAMSVLLAGGGLQMGQVIGKTSRKAEEPIERIMDSNCLLATIYSRFGIETAKSFFDNSGRPIPLLSSGTPIHELL
ncbi:MAG: DUF1501 domain-containing protein [Pirellulaceae bacterium]|nr:DUF1501 domain-containing protein [Pirellulaceae bacterium]